MQQLLAVNRRKFAVKAAAPVVVVAMSGAEKRPPRSLKAIVLALLVGQNAGLVLATSYSRLRRVKVMYLGATVVLLGEVLKLFISLALSAHEAGSLGAVSVANCDACDACDLIAGKQLLESTKPSKKLYTTKKVP